MEEIFDIHGRLVMRSPMWQFSRTRELSEDALRQAMDDPFFQEAIWLASPVLYEEALKWKNGSCDAKGSQKIIYSLAKYYQRLCTRTTPFGLFASCSSLPVGDNTELRSDEPYLRSTRLDMDFLCRLIQFIETNVHYKKLLRYRCNSSIYNVDNQYRYIEYKFITNKRKYLISASERDEYLEAVINLTKNNECSIKEIASILVSNDITLDDAEDFIYELIDNQILISNLEPGVVGDDVLVGIISELRKLNELFFEPLINSLVEINNELRLLDLNKINHIASYHNIAQKIKALGIEFEISKLFQVDIYKPMEQHASFSKEHLQSFFPLLEKLFAYAETETSSNLAHFIEKFRERYEEDEVPLTTLLDTDIGLGFPVNSTTTDAPLIDDFDVLSADFSGTVKMDAKNAYFFKTLLDAAVNKKYAIELDDDVKNAEETHKKLMTESASFQPSMSLLFRPTRLDSKDVFIFEGATGNSAIDMIGRFGHTDATISDTIKTIADHEQSLYPQFIFADILHLPEARVGNVILRPEIYNYQIPFISKSTKKQDHVININDIQVSINSQNVILLRSKKLNKYIIPRLSNAHNFYQGSLPVYNFLCSIQNQSKFKYLSFNWGVMGNYFKFHPRVVYKDIIVSLATWRMHPNEINDLKELFKNKSPELLAKVNAWRIENSMPDKMLLVQSDNELYIDFNNLLSVEAFLDEIKNKSQFELKEFLYKDENTTDSSPFISQMVVPLLRKKAQGHMNLDHSDQSTLVSKQFLSGTEVVYFKLYGGAKILEKIFITELLPVINSFIENETIIKWFFIRYLDPEYHLRIRLFMTNTNSLDKIFREFNRVLTRHIELQSLSSVKLDVYKREVKRYHMDLMDLTEDLFYSDSECVAKMLELISHTADIEKYRWLIGLVNVNALLDDAGIGIRAKYLFMKHIRESFFNEFNGNTRLNRVLGDKYRNNKIDIQNIFELNEQVNELYSEIRLILERRSVFTRKIFAEIKLKKDTDTFNSLMSSYIHMSLNRLFMINPRKHELVIYDFMERYYNSSIKRATSVAA